MNEGENLSVDEITELRELIKENTKLARDTNHILHRMRYWGRVAFWVKVLIWCVILSIPFLLVSYFAPLLNVLPGGLGGSTTSSSTSLFGFPSPAEVQQYVHNKF